jgi:hypothetical protein
MAGGSGNFGAQVELGYSKDIERTEVDVQENCDTTTETRVLEYQDGHFTAYSREETVDCSDDEPDEYFMDNESSNHESPPEAEASIESNTEPESE